MVCALFAAVCTSDLVLGPPEVEIPTAGHEGYMRCEPSIGASGKNVLVAWNDSVGGDHGSPSGVAVGWAWSEDSGRTYTVGGYLDESWRGADSRIVSRDDSGFVLLVLGKGGIRLYSMDADRMGELSDMGIAVAGDLLDKPAIAMDGQRVAIGYTVGTGEIHVARSSDGGKTFDRGVRVSSPEKMNRTGVSLAFDGPALHVAWTEGEGYAATQAAFSTAKEWGGAFAPASVAYRFKASPRAPTGQVMVGFTDGAYGLFSYDTALHVDGGAVHLTVIEGREGGSRVLALRSRDDGKTWAEPIDVSALFPTGHNAYAAVCAYRGDMAVLYYHQPAGSPEGTTEVAMTSLGVDASFTATVSSQPSAWKKVVGDAKRAPIQRLFGDYISVANDGSGQLYAAWTDGRAGTPTIMVRRLSAFPNVRRVR